MLPKLFVLALTQEYPVVYQLHIKKRNADVDKKTISILQRDPLYLNYYYF